MSRMLSKMNLISVVQQLPKDDVETIQGYVEMIEEENQELKKQLKPNYYVKGLEGTLKEYQQEMNKVVTQQKEFIDYLGNEKDRLVRECSQIYEGFLGKTRLVNKDIFNEVDTILSKYKEIIGDDNNGFMD